MHFKANLLKVPKSIPENWTRTQTTNWIQYTLEIDGIKIKLNIGNMPTIEFFPLPLDGEDPDKLLCRSLQDCIEVAAKLTVRLDIIIGRLEPSSKGEYVVYDPVAKYLSKRRGQITIEGLAKINASKPRRIGEFQFHDPRAAADYLSMPKRVARIERILDRLSHYFRLQDPN